MTKTIIYMQGLSPIIQLSLYFKTETYKNHNKDIVYINYNSPVFYISFLIIIRSEITILVHQTFTFL